MSAVKNRLDTTREWLFAPATDASARGHQAGMTFLRILLGLMWLYNVSWKRAPDFGQDSGNGLFKFTSYAVSDPVFPPYSWIVEHVVLNVFTPFGWLVLAAETTLAVLLLTGAWVRLAALIGVAQSVAIALSVAYAPHEWPWSYWLMIGAHVALLVTASGCAVGVDGVRARLESMPLLGQVWGGLSVVLGLISIVGSIGDPLAKRGNGLVSSDLSISLGNYNLLGGVVLLVAGALVVFSARGGSPRAAQGAAALAVLAALSLYAQLGFSDPILGGTPTSAAFLLALALVGAVVGGLLGRSSHDHASKGHR
ncbi:MAG: hypothetical protein ABIN79_09645 [Marmoricola sp.]